MSYKCADCNSTNVIVYGVPESHRVKCNDCGSNTEQSH